MPPSSFAAGAPGEYDYTVPEALREHVEPGRRVRTPLGRGNRLAVGYCVRLGFGRRAGRRLKPIHDVVDRRGLLSPAMLRLTAWIADEYLCPLGQVLDAVVPAGVRAQAGTRTTTVLSLAPEIVGRLDKLDLPAKQAEVLRASGRGRQAADAGPIGQGGRLHVVADRRAAPEGADPWPTPIASTPTARPSRRSDRERHLVLNPDQQAALDTILAAVERPAARDDPDPRRDRQRQDRGVHPGDSGGDSFRPPGDRAGAGDQPDAADARRDSARGSTAWPCCTAT